MGWLHRIAWETFLHGGIDVALVGKVSRRHRRIAESMLSLGAAGGLGFQLPGAEHITPAMRKRLTSMGDGDDRPADDSGAAPPPAAAAVVRRIRQAGAGLVGGGQGQPKQQGTRPARANLGQPKQLEKKQPAQQRCVRPTTKTWSRFVSALSRVCCIHP